MEASLAKFETSRIRLELQTITSKLETEYKRFELMEKEKGNIHQELNDKRVKLEQMQHDYVEAKKDLSRPIQSEHMHRELSEHITRLSEQNKGLQRELIGYKDQCLILQTKLSDAQLMLGSLKNQLDKEQQHREELQKMIQMHRW